MDEKLLAVYERILMLAERERKYGYFDQAAFGGFGNLVAEQDSPQLSRLGREYAEESRAYRPSILTKIEAQVKQDLGYSAAETASTSTAKASTSTSKAAKKPSATAVRERRAATTAGRGSSLDLPLSELRGVGEQRAQLFAKLGLHDLGQLLEFLPRTYRDRRQITPISQLQDGDLVNIRATIVKSENVRTRRGYSLLTCQVRDDSGSLQLIWFNQPFVQKRLFPGRELCAYGRVERRWDSLSCLVQEYQLTDEQQSGGLVPVYDLTAGLSNKTVTAAIKAAWQRAGNCIEDLLPPQLLQLRQLPSRQQCLHDLHFPESWEQIESSRRALAYQELLLLCLAQQRPSLATVSLQRPRVDDAALRRRFSQTLGFALTAAQQRVIDEIYADMDRPRPMSRLLQGDVGSGKTLVAAAAMLKCCAGGAQAALMAPTELLARQHYQTLLPLFIKMGMTLGLLTASTPGKEHGEELEFLASGDYNGIVGTHALIQPAVKFHRLGLAVVDEQHRFGVNQRALLRGSEADLLIMTATPIPRTLAMTLYADLAVSIIDQLPPGRQAVATYAVDYSYEKRLHNFIDKQLAAGGQAYVVCPVIDADADSDLAAVTAVYQRLSNEVFGRWRVGLLHGRLSTAAKEAVMRAFREGELDILVSTTVVEVGVDVPNANVMLVCDAERFGLAQLHQLRGRVGRGSRQSYCLLLHNAHSDTARQRMQLMCQLQDGFALAEADLQLRGPGEILGQRQSGLPELRAADLLADSDLLTQAQQDAQMLNQQGELPPKLQQKIKAMLANLS